MIPRASPLTSNLALSQRTLPLFYFLFLVGSFLYILTDPEITGPLHFLIFLILVGSFLYIPTDPEITGPLHFLISLFW